MILAAIDVGSNAARLLVTEVHTYKKKELDYTKLNLIRIPLRLGIDVFKQGYIGDERRKMFNDAMHAFKLIMEAYKVEGYRAVATSALRDAENGKAIVEYLHQLCGLKLEIITGQEEAAILYENHFEESLDKNTDHLYIDVGGGSTELTLFSNGKLQCKESFNIGTIRILTNKFDESIWASIKSFITSNVKGTVKIDAIGTGGNINKLFNLANKKDGQPLTLTTLRDYHQKLAPMSVKERMHVYKLKEDRADVLVPALSIYTQVMQWAKISNIFVPKIGVADGLIKLQYKERIKK